MSCSKVAAMNFPVVSGDMDIADPRLGVSFKFLKRHAYTLPMGFPHPIIAAHERGERY